MAIGLRDILVIINCSNEEEFCPPETLTVPGHDFVVTIAQMEVCGGWGERSCKAPTVPGRGPTPPPRQPAPHVQMLRLNEEFHLRLLSSALTE